MNKKWLFEEIYAQPWMHTPSTLTITGIWQTSWCYNQKKPRGVQGAATGSDTPGQIPPLPHTTGSNAIVRVNLSGVKFPFHHAEICLSHRPRHGPRTAWGIPAAHLVTSHGHPSRNSSGMFISRLVWCPLRGDSYGLHSKNRSDDVRRNGQNHLRRHGNSSKRSFQSIHFL